MTYNPLIGLAVFGIKDYSLAIVNNQLPFGNQNKQDKDTLQTASRVFREQTNLQTQTPKPEDRDNPELINSDQCVMSFLPTECVCFHTIKEKQSPVVSVTYKDEEINAHKTLYYAFTASFNSTKWEESDITKIDLTKYMEKKNGDFDYVEWITNDCNPLGRVDRAGIAQLLIYWLGEVARENDTLNNDYRTHLIGCSSRIQRYLREQNDCWVSNNHKRGLYHYKELV